MLKHMLKVVVLCALAGTLFAQIGQFVEAPQYTTGANPQAVAVGDFNGDGNLDLAVANASGNSVSVLLGQGAGTFGSKKDYPTGTDPLGIVAGDFNGDGRLDLAVTNFNSNTISILFGNGDGTFQAKVDYAVGTKPQGIAAGDLNKDGHVDIVVTNTIDDTVGVLLGRGDGTFNAQVTYRTGNNPAAVTIGDFNNDGIADIAVANNNSFTQAGVNVLLGNGNGTFQNRLQASTGLNPVSIAVADFNGDGNQDIAVANQQGNTVSVLLGDGKGGFAANVDYPTAPFPNSLTLADLDGDGKLDLAVVSGNGNAVSILWGVGDGTFRGQVNCGTGDIPYAVAAGDFNNDGKPDLVVTNAGANSVSIILNNGNQTFQSRIDYPAGHTPYSVAIGDFNGDGFMDVAVANSDCVVFPNCGPSAISIVLGNGDGTFGAPTPFSTGTDTDPYSIIVADFNGDKIPDLAVANYATNTVGIMLGVGDGTFQAHIDYPVGSEPDSVATGDFNGDGKIDLVVANFHSNTLTVLLGNGDGTFKAGVTYNVGHGPVSVAVGDFNGDKKLDLVVVNETDNNASVLLGNGDGTFKTQVAYPTGVGGNPLSVVVGDFNGDSILDLAVADFQTQQVSVLLGAGDGSFGKVTPFATGANPSSIVAADFNGDGHLDLALTSTPLGSSAGNLVSLLIGDGKGNFSAPALFGAGYLSYSVAAGDFNGDSAPDLVVANGASNTVSVLLNAKGTSMSVQSSVNPSGFGQSVTFTTTVAASVTFGAAPTGTVTLKNGGTVIGSGSLAGGQFSVSTTSLPAGTDTLSAVYSGDGHYQAHTVTLTQTVQTAGSGVALVSSLNPSAFTQSVTFTATVTSNSGVPTGSVTFYDGPISLGSATLNGSGVAGISTSTLSGGTHSITAVYGGDANSTSSTSPVLNQVVQGNTTTSLISSVNPSALGQSVLFTATVTSTVATPTGTVKFMDGTVVLGTSTVNGSGVAILSVSALNGGTHSVTAAYNGDTNSNPSTSTPVKQVVQKAKTSTTLNSTPAVPTVKQPVTFTATIASSVTGAPAKPSGTVSFLDGATQLGSASLNASGAAAFSTSSLSAGSHSITASYSGDTNFDVSTSSVMNLQISASDFGLSASALNPSTITPGKSAQSTVTITSLGGFDTSTVKLSCIISPSVNPAATCSMNAITVANSTGTSTLTVATAAPQAALASPFEKSGPRTLFALGLIVPAILFTGSGLNKSARQKLVTFCLVSIIAGGCMLQAACGGGGSKTPTPTGNSGTPSGTYTVIVTGTANGIQHSTSPISLSVQ